MSDITVTIPAIVTATLGDKYGNHTFTFDLSKVPEDVRAAMVTAHYSQGVRIRLDRAHPAEGTPQECGDKAAALIEKWESGDIPSDIDRGNPVLTESVLQAAAWLRARSVKVGKLEGGAAAKAEVLRGLITGLVTNVAMAKAGLKSAADTVKKHGEAIDTKTAEIWAGIEKDAQKVIDTRRAAKAKAEIDIDLS